MIAVRPELRGVVTMAEWAVWLVAMAWDRVRRIARCVEVVDLHLIAAHRRLR